MKYDLLYNYKDFLYNNYSDKTAKTYFNCADNLFKGLSFNEYSDINFDVVYSRLESLKYRNDFSKYKSALIAFMNFSDVSFSNSEQSNKYFSEQSKSKSKRKRKLKTRDLSKIKSKIDVIRDKRLITAFKIMLQYGLRVGEVSSISKDKIKKEKDIYMIEYTQKGGKTAILQINKKRNLYIFNQIDSLLSKNNESSAEGENNFFHSERFLQEQATKRDFTCHDLRRAYAKVEYAISKNLDVVRQKLRHENLRTTKIYVYSKIKI